VTLVAGIGLLVFAEPAWANGLGAVALIACAVTVFALASGPTTELAGRQAAYPPGSGNGRRPSANSVLPGPLPRYLVSDRDMSVLRVGDT
jgi:hypothetical protein